MTDDHDLAGGAVDGRENRGEMPFTGWEPFQGPDSADLALDRRRCNRRSRDPGP
jgi:hypothetical protein